VRDDYNRYERAAVKISAGPIADSGLGLRVQKFLFKRGINPCPA
jgi:hypothetical protein